MVQEKESYDRDKDYQVYIPKNSTDITSGDIVVMPRKSDPMSRSTLGALGRISPISTAFMASWVVGIADSAFSTDTVGSTLYAAPTSNEAIPVYKRGVFRLAMVDTSGNAGDLVKYSSGGTGAQLFTVTSRVSEAIGMLEKTYSGASANDLQTVKLLEKDEVGLDLAHFLDNRILNDCIIVPQTKLSIQSVIGVGRTFTGNRQGQMFIIKGKYFRVTRDTSLNIGKLTGGAVSRCKARMIVARSGGFAYRTCSGYKTLTTFTKTGFSAAYFTPTTQTSGELAIGYVVFASAVTNATAGMIFNVRGISRLPVGYCHWSL